MQKSFSEAIHFIKHHQDGEIAEMLVKRGLQYNMIYGVSSALLQSYAKKEGKNHALAMQLWQQDFREAKLLALMFADENETNADEINGIVTSFSNHELVEIATLHFLPSVKNIQEMAYDWILHDKVFVKMTGYMVFNRLAKLRKPLEPITISLLVTCFKKDFTHSSLFIRNAVTQTFQEIAFRYPHLKKEVIFAAEYILSKNLGTEFENQAKDMLHVLTYC